MANITISLQIESGMYESKGSEVKFETVLVNSKVVSKKLAQLLRLVDLDPDEIAKEMLDAKTPN